MREEERKRERSEGLSGVGKDGVRLWMRRLLGGKEAKGEERGGAGETRLGDESLESIGGGLGPAKAEGLAEQVWKGRRKLPRPRPHRLRPALQLSSRQEPGGEDAQGVDVYPWALGDLRMVVGAGRERLRLWLVKRAKL